MNNSATMDAPMNLTDIMTLPLRFALSPLILIIQAGIALYCPKGKRRRCGLMLWRVCQFIAPLYVSHKVDFRKRKSEVGTATTSQSIEFVGLPTKVVDHCLKETQP